jgi:hypothetical protein
MKRPGVHERWIKLYDPGKHKPHYSEAAVAAQESELASWGEAVGTDEPWWFPLHSPCQQYATHKLDALQTRVLQTGKWDHALASSVADANELALLILLRMRSPELQNTAPFAFLQGFAYSTVLMLVEGQTDRALRLGNALVTASRYGAYPAMMSHFEGHFIINALADFLDRKPNPIRTRTANRKAFNPEPYLDSVIGSWRTQDEREMAETLLTLCDIHTQIGWHGAKWMEREFTNGFWPRIPLAAWLVCKFRELRGLKTPQIEHPIMETALGRLPSPGYVVDPVVAKLRERADRDGLDIDETLAYFGGDIPAT